MLDERTNFSLEDMDRESLFHPLTSIDARVETMDRMGIDRQVLSPLPLVHFHDAPVEPAIEFCRAHNDCTANTVKQRPDRFWGLAALPMQDAEAAARELKRAIGELGLSGAQIGSHIAGRPLSDPALARNFFRCRAVCPARSRSGARASRARQNCRRALQVRCAVV